MHLETASTAECAETAENGQTTMHQATSEVVPKFRCFEWSRSGLGAPEADPPSPLTSVVSVHSVAPVVLSGRLLRSGRQAWLRTIRDFRHVATKRSPARGGIWCGRM